jgi:hypothetical protein
MPRRTANLRHIRTLVCNNATATHFDSGRSFVLFRLMGQNRFTHVIPSTLNTRCNFGYVTNLQQNGWYTYRTTAPLLIGYKNWQLIRGNGMNVTQLHYKTKQELMLHTLILTCNSPKSLFVASWDLDLAIIRLLLLSRVFYTIYNFCLSQTSDHTHHKLRHEQRVSDVNTWMTQLKQHR